MRKNISKVWGKIRKIDQNLRKNEESRTLAHPRLWGWLRPASLPHDTKLPNLAFSFMQWYVCIVRRGQQAMVNYQLIQHKTAFLKNYLEQDGSLLWVVFQKGNCPSQCAQINVSCPVGQFLLHHVILFLFLFFCQCLERFFKYVELSCNPENLKSMFLRLELNH